METLVRLGLRAETQFSEVERVCASLGTIRVMTSSMLVFQWSPVARAIPLDGETAERVASSRIYMEEPPEQLLWDLDDGTLARSGDVVRTLANFWRMIAVCERFVEAGLCTWWIVGLNRSTSSPSSDIDVAAFVSSAAFRNDRIPRPDGFVAIGSVNVALSALSRLPMLARAKPLAPGVVELAAALTEYAGDGLRYVDLVEEIVRADVTPVVQRAVDRLSEDD